MKQASALRWVGLKWSQLPTTIVSSQSGEIELSGVALSVLDVLYTLAANVFRARPHNRYFPMPEIPLTVRIKQQTLCERAGLSKRAVINAIQELVGGGFIERQSGGGLKSGRGRQANTYFILNPETGHPIFRKGEWLGSSAWRRTAFGWDRTMLGCNKVRYFTFPCHLVTDLLPVLDKRSEVPLYHAILLRASECRNAAISAQHGPLRKISGIKTPATFIHALKRLHAMGLVHINGSEIVLGDPETRTAMNVTAIPSEMNRHNWLQANSQKFDPVKELHRDPLRVLTAILDGAAQVKPAAGTEYRFCCPFHIDNSPSASIDVSTGLWVCFAGCGEGNLWQLVMRMHNLQSAREAQVTLAEMMGVELKYFEPTSYYKRLIQAGNLFYDYFDQDGSFLFRKFRIVNSDGNKKFPVFVKSGENKFTTSFDGGHKGRALYRWPLPNTTTVCVCEGEKDVHTIESLGLIADDGSPVLATTSGGSTSWVDHFANPLSRLRVIVMPDRDLPGRRYADRIRKSLSHWGNEPRIVEFSDLNSKDVSDFIEQGGTAGDVAERIGNDWVSAPDTAGSRLVVRRDYFKAHMASQPDRTKINGNFLAPLSTFSVGTRISLN